MGPERRQYWTDSDQNRNLQCLDAVKRDQKTQVIDDLIKLRTVLGLPNAWTQRVFARNKEGLEVTMMSPRATCWCISGGLSVICSDPGGRSVRYQLAHEALLKEAHKEMPGINFMVNYNDCRSQSQVLGLIDRVLTGLRT